MPSTERTYVEQLLAAIRQSPGVRIVDARHVAGLRPNDAYHAFKALRDSGRIERDGMGWRETDRSRQQAEAL